MNIIRNEWDKQIKCFKGNEMATGILTGTIKNWNDKKGFGFIRPQDGGDTIFVHISAFGNNLPRRPIVGDTIYYHYGVDSSGKPKALDAKIAGVESKIQTTKLPRTRQKNPPRHSLKLFAIAIALILYLAVFAYNRYFPSPQQPATSSQSKQDIAVPMPAPSTTTTAILPTPYSCDGRTDCSQMTSCEEATYFLQNCPNTKMDGNNDGVPCEQQWCN